MRRVVVTGMGIVSCLGNDKASVTSALREGRSGISFIDEYKEMGLRSHVAGHINNLNLSERIDRKVLRFMGEGSGYAYIPWSKPSRIPAWKKVIFPISVLASLPAPAAPAPTIKWLPSTQLATKALNALAPIWFHA